MINQETLLFAQSIMKNNRRKADELLIKANEECDPLTKSIYYSQSSVINYIAIAIADAILEHSQ